MLIIIVICSKTAGHFTSGGLHPKRLNNHPWLLLGQQSVADKKKIVVLYTNYPINKGYIVYLSLKAKFAFC